MNRKEFRRPAYIRPCMNLLPLQAEPLLLETSGNAGKISKGASGGDAKSGWFDEEEMSLGEGDLEESSSWAWENEIGY